MTPKKETKRAWRKELEEIRCLGHEAQAEIFDAFIDGELSAPFGQPVLVYKLRVLQKIRKEKGY